jgi:holo-[acyl-carrier protein] synthase
MLTPPGPAGGAIGGVGIDVVEAARIGRLLRRLPAAHARLFSDDERAYAERFADPFPRYAARFAAKEAVGKALGIGIIGFVWRDIEVVSGGQPRIALHGDVAAVAERLGVTRVDVSLSHTGGLAYAVAVALKEGADG